MSFLHVKCDKTKPLKKYILVKIARQNCEKVVSSGRGMDCAVSRQMSASPIKLDFRPVFREANRETFTKNSGISKTLLFFQERSLVYCLILVFFVLSSFSFLEMK
jgi:hypothetical protein